MVVARKLVMRMMMMVHTMGISGVCLLVRFFGASEILHSVCVFNASARFEMCWWEESVFRQNSNKMDGE
jgi:hypothetical protein